MCFAITPRSGSGLLLGVTPGGWSTVHGIGLDLYRPGISTDSARGPETTGNNRHHSDNTDTRTGRLTPEWGGPPSVLRPRKTAGQAYRTGSPVTARPMIMRWISLVPSKMVKIVE